MVPTVDFRDRERELERLRELVKEGRGVLWVTGPSQAGKSWLISRHLKARDAEGGAARFELREKPLVEGFFEGVNAFLREREEDGFNAALRSPHLDVEGRAARLCQVLRGGAWVLLLDSFESVAEDAEWERVVKVMQEGSLDGSVVFVGSRVMPEWGDRQAELALGPMDEEEGKGMLAESGVRGDAADELFERTGGLPGALEVAGALAADRGAGDVLRDVKGAAGEIGESLLAETFEAAGEGAKRLWAGLCVLPGAVMRQTGEALCERDDFAEAWSELVRRKLLEPGEERAELHPLARTVGEARLRGMVEWEEECGRRIADFYAQFAEEKKEDRAAVEGELENVLAAARLAFRYGEWDALWQIGDRVVPLLLLTGRWATGEELVRLYGEGARDAKEPARELLSLGELANLAYRRGDLPAAEERYAAVLTAAQTRQMRKEEGTTLHQLGMVAQARGKLDEAEGLYRESLEIKREVRDRPGEASTLHNLGALAQQRGKLDEAEGLYRESLEIEREVGSRPGIAMSLHQLGRVAQDRGKLEEAEGLYRESLEMKREVGDRPGEAAALHQLGMVAQDRGKLDEAEDWYKQSLEIEREVGNRPGEARTMAQMALLAEKQEDLKLAVERMEKACAMLEEMGLAEQEKAREHLDRLKRRLRKEG